MIRSIAAQIGLLGFSAAIVIGLVTGNAPTTILIRALTIAFAALIVGQVAAWVGKMALRDELIRRKVALDMDHIAALRAAESGEAVAAEPAAE